MKLVIISEGSEPVMLDKESFILIYGPDHTVVSNMEDSELVSSMETAKVKLILETCLKDSFNVQPG